MPLFSLPLLVSTLGLAAPPAPVAVPAPLEGTPACEVFRREASFARSVDEGDAGSFGEHLDPEAKFGVGTPGLLEGRDAVVAGWMPLIEGRPTRLRWRPQYVHVARQQDLASSHGPYLLTRQDEAGNTVHASGRFFSVWKRAPDGQWYVLFDGGEPARPIEAGQAATVFDGLAADCRTD
ncbi:YybH family protein [Pseudomarimonas salicorniae]|uniref:Nuclear transport factor 2 family protein n=1 Tax=Pseudomarimonas salicorniae TaxID=2933270 RepID=A0ABT0GLY5_9GAMM|nr:nuclear transport factor 2 family protein [Lysobacter sp. CAU 1642]MCK7595035.1 nuclear transport factor 2 family protein [Lysobacter sp. CAU 1642]